MPGPGQLIKYPTVPVQRANVMGETSGIEAVEVGDCTMPTNHFLEIVWCSNPG
jgi:hypothetical protein